MARPVASVLLLIVCFVIGSSHARPGERTCGPPPTVDQAFPRTEFTEENLLAGTTISYTCRIGHATHGDTRVHCVDFGSGVQWTKPRFSCHPILCEPPERPDNGQLIGTDHSYGQSITYSCNQGYKMWSSDEKSLLTESPERTCTADGTWNSQLPLCKPVTCPVPGAPDHGSVEVYLQTYMSKSTYYCNAGYRLEGESERLCLENGEWSGTQPSCEEIEEPEEPDEPWKPAIDDIDPVTANKPSEKKSWFRRQWDGLVNFFRKLCSWC